MSVMKTSLTIIPMCPRELLSHYKKLSRLILCYIKDWATLLHFIYFIYFCSLLFILSQNYLLPTISVLAEKTLLKTAYHFLLLLVGFDTLTYRKDYDRSPTLVGHQDSFLAPLPGSVQLFSFFNILFNRISSSSGVLSLKTEPAQLSK